MSHPRLRAALVVGLTVAAYHHSLRALGATLGADTPLAYLGLVPVLALAVALVKGRPRPGEGRLPHRHADWIVASSLLSVAAFVALALPDRLSYAYWTNRIDLLGLPFFAAGVTALLLGGRVLYRVRLPLAMLALAWPLPYQLVLDRVVAAAGAFTTGAVGLAAPVLGVGRRTSGTLFDIGDGTAAFAVNVAPQCAGASSVLGFLLVGGATVSVLGGSRRGKALWLLTGLAAQLVLNVARILAVFAVGDRFGERAAIDWLHPYLGLVLFTASTAVLVALLPRYGVPLLLPSAAPAPARRAAWVPRPALVVGVTAGALVLATTNAALRRFDPFLGVGSAAAYRPLVASPVVVAGWHGRHARTIDWAKPYFGASSTWHRLMYDSVAGPRKTVWLDVVSTPDLGSFSRYGVEACYRFHRYAVVDSGTVDIGAPARAQTMTYRDGTATWSLVSWVWPVGDAGARRFERVVALTGHDASPEAGRRARGELVTFARSVARSAAPARA